MQPLSDKQYLAYKDSDARINIWQGAVRSGKTYSSLLKFVKLLRKGPPGHAMIIGVTRDSIQRNLVIDLCQLIGARIPGSKSTEMNLFGRQVYFVGANDESSVRRIQGATLAMALVDEATEIPEAFWNMLLSRLSVPGAQLLATLNPSSPGHWLKHKFIDRQDELNLKSWHFLLEDNPILTTEYVEGLKKEYSAPGNGMWFKRYILGEWAVAEGLVYDGFDEMNLYEDDYPQPNMWVAGVDYGTTNPTACVLAGISPKQWPQIHIEKEYYYSSKTAGRQKSDAELADDIKEFIGWRPLEALYVDPSAASFKIELRNRGLPVVDALHDVMPGIRTTHKFITHKNLVVHKSCKHLREELGTYSYCPKKAARGIDGVIKDHDHVCFVAGTLIATENGQKPIEEVGIGDMVLTRKGYRPVVSTMVSDSSDIWELKTGANTLIGTGDHPIWANNKMVPIKRLQGYTDILVLKKEIQCQSQNKLYSKEKFTVDIPIAGIKVLAGISALTERQPKKRNAFKNRFIAKYGKINTGKSPLGHIYIIKMATHLTIKLRILNAYQRKSMQDVTRRTYEDVLTFLRIMQKVTRDEKKLKKNPRSFGLKSKQKLQNVKCVGFSTNIDTQVKRDIAVRDAMHPGDEKINWIMKTECVPIVATPLTSTNFTSNSVAVNRAGYITDGSKARKKETVRKVYNIEVEDEHEYFANNILVGNCDALRYLVYSSFSSGEIDSISDHLTIDQRRELAYGESSLMDSLGASGPGGYF